jgi:hypothetical protein
VVDSREFKGSKRVKAEEPMNGLKGVGHPEGSAVVQRSVVVDPEVEAGDAFDPGFLSQ